MRQAQSFRACSGTMKVTARPTRAPPMVPSAVETGLMLANRARLPTGACSTTKLPEPAYSPPADSPWRMRQASSRTGAMTPMVANVGVRPMPRVAALMRITAVDRAALRPLRSPYWPKSSPPTGRARKPTAKTAKVAKRLAVGSSEGKKWKPMMVANWA